MFQVLNLFLREGIVRLLQNYTSISDITTFYLLFLVDNMQARYNCEVERVTLEDVSTLLDVSTMPFNKLWGLKLNVNDISTVNNRMSIRSLNKCIVLHRVMKKLECSFKKYVPTFRHVPLFCIKHPVLLEIKFFGEPFTLFYFSSVNSSLVMFLDCWLGNRVFRSFQVSYICRSFCLFSPNFSRN